MRTFTPAMSSVISSLTNLEPVIVVGVEWAGAGSEILYADRDIGTAPSVILGRILQISELDNVLSSTTGGTSAISVTLDDTDGTIKSLIDQHDPYGKPATIYQTFNESTLGVSMIFWP